MRTSPAPRPRTCWLPQKCCRGLSGQLKTAREAWGQQLLELFPLSVKHPWFKLAATDPAHCYDRLCNQGNQHCSNGCNSVGGPSCPLAQQPAILHYFLGYFHRATMEKSWTLWSFVERWLIALASWSWALCRISLLPLIVTFHLYGGIILLLLIFISIAGILYKFQDVLLYFPEQPSSSRLYVPMPTGIPHENIFIRTKDGVRLNLILIRYTGDSSPYSPTIIYFHGNAGNIGHRLPNALLMLVNLKVNLLLVDYRGYGKSEGEASEEGLYLDSEAVLDYVMTRPDLDKTKIFLFGRSLGGAVAIHLASENSHRISAILVENTFLSIPHMASTLFSFFPMRYLPLWCYKNKFLSYRKISQCRMPSLFISGLSDQLIPPVMMKQLYELSPSRTKRLAVFPEGTHNDTWQCQGYFSALEQFIREVMKSHSPEEMAKTSSSVTII